jgi:hypothetical protein
LLIPLTGKMPVLLSVAIADEVTSLCRLQWLRREYVSGPTKQSTKPDFHIAVIPNWRHYEAIPLEFKGSIMIGLQGTVWFDMVRKGKTLFHQPRRLMGDNTAALRDRKSRRARDQNPEDLQDIKPAA